MVAASLFPLCRDQHGHWSKHAETKVLFQSLQLISHRSPRMGILENVLGLRAALPGEKSPLEMVIKRLEALQYSVAFVESDLSLFHKVSRRRTSLLGVM